MAPSPIPMPLPPGPNPAQVHNLFAMVIAVYGPMLDQQQKLIDLLTAQNRELQGQLEQARKGQTSRLNALEAELEARAAAEQKGPSAAMYSGDK